MRFIRSSDWHPAIKVLQTRLIGELSADKRVLWLVSGGSNVQASVRVMQEIPPEITKNLSVILADERYGPVGHPDSNGAQLLAAGFDPIAGRLLPVLLPNTSFAATRDHYEDTLTSALQQNDIVIAQFGIGADGHIAGIMPHSEATTSPDLIAAYTSPPYQRLTMTDHALKHVAVAYALAYGDDKKPALELLSSKLVPYAVQPSQILKELPEAYVFSDQIGESV